MSLPDESYIDGFVYNTKSNIYLDDFIDTALIEFYFNPNTIADYS